ncbi:helix-turn-helix transcriptional regulator [Aeromonas diversa]|uniref:helix-turn-helix transcriptional regulator n=1 Tax=Aeromonas diversa TaxID=502790 RepID=UPI0039A3B885
MSDIQTERHIAILNYLPCEPRSVSSIEIMNRLERDGFEVNKRMVQRDMEKLSSRYSIVSDETVRPYRWSRKEGSKGWLDMTPSTALALCMAKPHLQVLLPRHLQGNLADFFTQAEQRLAHSHEKLANWPQKIASYPAGFQLIAPGVDSRVVEEVERALFEQRVLALEYTGRPPRAAKHYMVNPLALVTKGSTLYLVATLVADGELRHFALHRAQSAVLQDKAATIPATFDLHDYLAKGNLGFSRHQQIELVLRVNFSEGYHLQESRLSENQWTEPDGVHHFILHATVNDTEELRWWLMSIADISEVLAPLHLRDLMMASLRQGLANYATS